MYSAEVLQRFQTPNFAVSAKQNKGQASFFDDQVVQRIRVGSLAQGNLIELWALIGHQQLHALRFRAYGSAALIALTDAFCEQAEGLALSELTQLSIASLQQRLAIPNTEIHVVLLLTEALQKLNIELQASTSEKLATDLYSK